MRSRGQGSEGPKEACGLFGVWAPGGDVARLTFFGLLQLQHRGQESAGIASWDGKQIHLHKAMGLVADIFTQQAIAGLFRVALSDAIVIHEGTVPRLMSAERRAG